MTRILCFCNEKECVLLNFYTDLRVQLFRNMYPPLALQPEYHSQRLPFINQNRLSIDIDYISVVVATAETTYLDAALVAPTNDESCIIFMDRHGRIDCVSSIMVDNLPPSPVAEDFNYAPLNMISLTFRSRNITVALRI